MFLVLFHEEMYVLQFFFIDNYRERMDCCKTIDQMIIYLKLYETYM